MSVPLLDDAHYLVIVKRGEAPLLLALAHFLESVSNVEVIWDRRIRDRRSAQVPVDEERRVSEQRHASLTSPVLALLAQHGPRPDSGLSPAA